MPNPVSRTYSITFLFLIVLILGGCKLIYNSEFIPAPDQEISGPIEIGPQWIEITPPNPLVPYKSLQNVDVLFDEYEYSESEHDGMTVGLKNGKKTKIEAFLYDEQGQEYELRISSYGRGVGLARKPIPVDKNDPDYNGWHEKHNPFPKDKKFVKLKIKSEIPIKTEKIKWVCYNNK